MLFRIFFLPQSKQQLVLAKTTLQVRILAKHFRIVVNSCLAISLCWQVVCIGWLSVAVNFNSSEGDFVDEAL